MILTTLATPPPLPPTRAFDDTQRSIKSSIPWKSPPPLAHWPEGGARCDKKAPPKLKLVAKHPQDGEAKANLASAQDIQK